MKKARAAAATITGLALIGIGALGVAAHNADRTLNAHVALDDPSESPEASESPDPSETQDASESPDPSETLDASESADAAGTNAGAQGAHGAEVSAVAQDPSLVGGPNSNHGGPVSVVARGSHGGGKSNTHGKSGLHKPS